MKCCDLTAGKLRHLIDFQSEQMTADGGGGNTLAWTSFVSGVRGFINPVSANERVFGQRLEHNITHRLWVRYRTDVSSEHRVLYSGRSMQIRGIRNLEERNQWLEIDLEEGVVT